MHLAIDPQFAERVVFEATRSDHQLCDSYHRAFSRCYQAPSDRQREDSFKHLHDEWFTHLGFRTRLENLIAECPHVNQHVSRTVVCGLNQRQNHGAELYGRPGRYTMVITVPPSLLLNEAAFLLWARHELLHVDDMLDPGFAYQANARVSGSSPLEYRRILERYSALWAMSIDARLTAKATAHPAAKSKRQAEFLRVFGLSNPALAKGSFEALWERFRRLRPSHADLLAWAGGKAADSSMDGGPSSDGRGCLGGEPCPLCGFPTFDWAEMHRRPSGSFAAVKSDAPQWRVQDGMCGQCAELYRSRESSKERAATTAAPRGQLAANPATDPRLHPACRLPG